MADSNTIIKTKLRWGLVLNTGFAILELIVGLTVKSLALISDATHNLTDSLSLTIAYVGQKIAQRKATHEHTYGYGKATILTALLNSLIMAGFACYILYSAYQRILHPQAVAGGIVALVAGIGIVVNGSIAYLFRKERISLNMRGAYLNMLYDTLVSAGALLAGVIIWLTKNTLADPVISIAVGLMMLKSGWNIIDEAVHILLEGAPNWVNAEQVKACLITLPNVVSVPDLHVWVVSENEAAMTAYVVVNENNFSKVLETVQNIKKEIRQKFNITHSTIETMLQPSPPHKH